MKLKLSLAVLALVLACEVSAQTNIRQKKQKQRTQQGIESGEITQREAAKIKTQQRHVNLMKS